MKRVVIVLGIVVAVLLGGFALIWFVPSVQDRIVQSATDAADRQERPRAVPQRRRSAHSPVRHRIAHARHDEGQCLRRGDRERPRGGVSMPGLAPGRGSPPPTSPAPRSTPCCSRISIQTISAISARWRRKAGSADGKCRSRCMGRRRRNRPSAPPTRRARPSAWRAPRTSWRASRSLQLGRRVPHRPRP